MFHKLQLLTGEHSSAMAPRAHTIMDREHTVSNREDIAVMDGEASSQCEQIRLSDVHER